MPKVVTTKNTTVTKSATVSQKAVEISKATQAAIISFIETRDMLRALEKTKKELEFQIRQALGDAEVGTVKGNVRVEVSARARKTIDSALLEEAFPEAYEAALKVSEYSVLVAK